MYFKALFEMIKSFWRFFGNLLTSNIKGNFYYPGTIITEKYTLFFLNNFRMNILKLDHCDTCCNFELSHVTRSFAALEAIVKTSKDNCEAIKFKAKIPEKMRKP